MRFIKEVITSTVLMIFILISLSHSQPFPKIRWNDLSPQVKDSIRSDRSLGESVTYDITKYGVTTNISDTSNNAIILNSLIDSITSNNKKGIILIPKGTYYYSAPLVIDKSSVFIQGINDSTSILKYTGSGNAIEINITPPDYILGYTIKDLHISGTSSATSIIKISDAVSSVGDGFIESVKMDSAAYGIWIAGVSWCNIFDRISMRFFTTCALYFNGTSNLNLFTNSRFQESGTGVLTNVGEVRTLKFLNCSFQDNTLSVWLKYGYDISFDHCWFEKLTGAGASIDLGVNATPYLHRVNVENCHFVSGDYGIRLVGAVDGFKAENNTIQNIDYVFVKILNAAMESEVEVSGTRSSVEDDYFVQITNSSGYANAFKGDYFSMNRNFVIDLTDTLWLWQGEYDGLKTPITVIDDTILTGGVLRPDQLLISKGDSLDYAPLYNSWYRDDSLFYELENGDIIFIGKKVGTTLTESTINAKIVAFYDLDDDGVWADSVGNLDLIENGAVICTTGIYGDCANFSGLSNVWLDHDDAPAYSFGDVSMGVFAWVKLEYYINCGVVSKDGTSSGTRDWCLGFDYAGGDHFFFSRGKSSGDATIDIVYTPWIPSYAKWYLLFGWYNKAKGYLFIRGFDQYNPISFDSVLVTGTPYDSGQEFQIGSRLSAEFTGKIDEVGILNAVPTEQEMLDVWNSGKGRKFPYWKR